MESNKTVLRFILIFVLKVNTHLQPTRPVWVEPHEKQIPSLGVFFQVTVPLNIEKYRESTDLRFCAGPVNSLWSNTSSGVAAQNILISRALFTLALGNLSLTTLRAILLWTCDLSATDDKKKKRKRKRKGPRVPNTTKHCGCQRKALWLTLWTAASLAAQQ